MSASATTRIAAPAEAQWRNDNRSSVLPHSIRITTQSKSSINRFYDGVIPDLRNDESLSSSEEDCNNNNNDNHSNSIVAAAAGDDDSSSGTAESNGVIVATTALREQKQQHQPWKGRTPPVQRRRLTVAFPKRLRNSGTNDSILREEEEYDCFSDCNNNVDDEDDTQSLERHTQLKPQNSIDKPKMLKYRSMTDPDVHLYNTTNTIYKSSITHALSLPLTTTAKTTFTPTASPAGALSTKKSCIFRLGSPTLRGKKQLDSSSMSPRLNRLSPSKSLRLAVAWGGTNVTKTVNINAESNGYGENCNLVDDTNFESSVDADNDDEVEEHDENEKWSSRESYLLLQREALLREVSPLSLLDSNDDDEKDDSFVPVGRPSLLSLNNIAHLSNMERCETAPKKTLSLSTSLRRLRPDTVNFSFRTGTQRLSTAAAALDLNETSRSSCLSQMDIVRNEYEDDNKMRDFCQESLMDDNSMKIIMAAQTVPKDKRDSVWRLVTANCIAWSVEVSHNRIVQRTWIAGIDTTLYVASSLLHLISIVLLATMSVIGSFMRWLVNQAIFRWIFVFLVKVTTKRRKANRPSSRIAIPVLQRVESCECLLVPPKKKSLWQKLKTKRPRKPCD